MPKQGLRRQRVTRALIIVTLAAHVVLALAASRYWSWLLVVAALASSFVVCRQALRRRIEPDVPQPPWRRRLSEVCWVHWATCLIAAPWVGLLLCLAVSIELLGWVWGLSCLVSIWGVVLCRRWVRVTELEIPAQIPREFHGYGIAHLSDLHIGSIDPRAAAERWVALANRLGPDLVVVTGDLVTHGTAFYRDVCTALAQLEAPDGVIVSLGNHDQSDVQALTRGLEAVGVRVLRNQCLSIERGPSRLTVVGLDGRLPSQQQLSLLLGGCPQAHYNILLSHYPDAFDVAISTGVALTLSGHTHGGQIGVPWFGDRWNIASLTGQRSRGLVAQGGALLHVSAGLGTTGIPFRLGVRPEITLLRLQPSAQAADQPDPSAVNS